MPDNFTARTGAVQDTGNPVFDATCNLIMNWPTAAVKFHGGGMEGLHADLLALYNKEPKRTGGTRPTAKSLSQMSDEIGAR